MSPGVRPFSCALAAFAQTNETAVPIASHLFKAQSSPLLRALNYIKSARVPSANEDHREAISAAA